MPGNPQGPSRRSFFPDTLAQVLEGQPWVMGLTEHLAQAVCFQNSKLSLKTVPGLLACPLACPV